VLFIDEGTANLDVELERRINEMMADLPITRIHVAHRPQTIALADRVIELAHSTTPMAESEPAAASTNSATLHVLKREG
jgi:ATP-binding cassette, subfamily B, bacterial CvaB/MchF/RaxB